ncbi:MAG TPA: carbamoyltransferase C-terminal domain-containing protein [Longimicrobium sp.]|nr:carbamoyltransferase C-terminal domain-containing protein [Longimicrobium sp.]
MYVLGVHLGHDAGAALIRDGVVLAAADEERFAGIKHYAGLPMHAAEFCLRQAGIRAGEVDCVAVASDTVVPEMEFLLGFAPKQPGGSVRLRAATAVRRRLGLPAQHPPLYREPLGIRPDAEVRFVEHHLAHAASAYYTSGHTGKTLIITADGIGDRTSTAVWSAEDGRIRNLMRVGGEGSVGWFYGLVTEALGWWVGDGEWKTMGLAPYGDARTAAGALDAWIPRYRDGRLERGVNFGAPRFWRERGTYHWHFRDAAAVRAVVERVGRQNAAAEAQRLVEEEMGGFVEAWLRREGVRQGCFAGGVFLNVKLNQRVWEMGVLDRQHIFPAAGDSGLCVGAALLASHELAGTGVGRLDSLYWGPAFPDEEIEEALRTRKLRYARHEDDLPERCAELLSRGAIVGWFQGRMEFGPRALGSRSILMDPRDARNKEIVNAAVKYREPFRPFCPSMLADALPAYCRDARPEPFMITSFRVREERAGEIPAVVHVDGTLRPQGVERETNPRYWRLIRRFEELTGVPVVMNTSFNVRGMPVVCTPADAVKCFFDTGLDYLAIGSFLLAKDGVSPGLAPFPPPQPARGRE